MTTLRAKIWGHKLKLIDRGGSMWPPLLAEMKGFYASMADINFMPGDVVLDIGAHVGTVSIALAKIHPEIKIIALEPEPHNFADLLVNRYMNDAFNVTTINKGVSSNGRDLILVNTKKWQSTAPSAFRDMTDKDTLVTVKTTTLSAIIHEFCPKGCKLLKMDCEGAEYEVLIANPAVLHRVEHLYMEIHYNNILTQRGYEPTDLEYLVRARMPDDKVHLTGVKRNLSCIRNAVRVNLEE
jgi:FkbM family methyltransferase